MTAVSFCRLLFLALLWPVTQGATLAAERLYPLTSRVLTLATAPDALAPSLTTSPDGNVYLAWIEPAKEGGRLLSARYAADVARWSAPHVITAGAQLFFNAADTPVITAGDRGTLAALWLETTPGGGTQAHVSRSADAGVTWGAPTLLTAASEHVEFPAVALLPDGRLLTAWLDGRGKATGGPMRLYARVIGADGPDTLVDASVCDCCQTGLTVFPNGSALLTYRGRTKGEIRDIHVAAWDGNQWSPGHVLSADDWHINACPVNGPRIASAGGQASVVWFTAADNDPRVQASTSPDAGRRFLMPQRIDAGHALGRTDTCLLRDGSVLATWLEGGDTPGLYLRWISTSGERFAPVKLAITRGGRDGGYPRMTLLKDYDTTPAQIIVTYTEQGSPHGVHTLLLTLPGLSTLAKRDPCLPCDEEDANATRGYPIKGRVTQVLPAQNLVLVQHEEIPGVMRAMTMGFKVDPQLLPQLTAGQELLGRIERRDRDWWLFHVRLLGALAKPAQSRAP